MKIKKRKNIFAFLKIIAVFAIIFYIFYYLYSRNIFASDIGVQRAGELAAQHIEERYNANISVVSCVENPYESMGDYGKKVCLYDNTNNFEFTVFVCLRGFSVVGIDLKREWTVDEQYESALTAYSIKGKNEAVSVEEILSEDITYSIYNVTLSAKNDQELKQAFINLTQWYIDSKKYFSPAPAYINYYLKCDMAGYEQYKPLKICSKNNSNTQDSYTWFDSEDYKTAWNNSTNYSMNEEDFKHQNVDYFLNCYTDISNSTLNET